MQLIYDPVSTSSRIVTFFLHDHEIAFDEKIVTLANGEQFDVHFGSINPNREVPVLIDDDGFRLTQCAVIIDYLAIRRGLEIIPFNYRERTRVGEAVSWFQTNFHVYHCALLSYSHILPDLMALDNATLATVRKIGQAGSDKYLRVLNDHMIGDNDFVCGNRMTLADYVGAANVTLGFAAGMDFSGYPNVQRWLRTLRARKGWAPAYSSFENMLMANRIQKVA